MSSTLTSTRRLEMAIRGRRRDTTPSSSYHRMMNSVFKSTAAVSDRHQETTSSYFKPWKVPCVESHGDYREEAWLEDHIGGPLYAHQATLPRLPVPPIDQTMERFLPTALPLARTPEEATALQQAVQKFPTQAAPLQERLLERARDPTNANSSWLQLWWNQLGYLQVRDPVIINVSYFFHFADDPTLAASSHETASTDAQIQRGAAILTAVGHFRKQVCSGTLPAETVGKGDRSKTLCSAAYKYMFHGCRIPALTQDSYKIYDPALHHHAIVAVQGHFFAVDLCDPVTADPYSVYELEAALRECRERAASLAQDEDGAPTELGWLTSSNRDDWAQARATLLQQGGAAMERALERLESGAVLLNLDDDPAVSRAECAEKMLHGGLAAGGNRWFDKSIQLIVARNGKAGLLGEHSMMDGMPVVSLADRITQTTYRDACVQSSKSGGGNGASSSSCRVETIFPSSLQEKVRGAAEPLVEKGTSTTMKSMPYYQGTVSQQDERSVSQQTITD